MYSEYDFLSPISSQILSTHPNLHHFFLFLIRKQTSTYKKKTNKIKKIK